jgi:hypothetical protein
MEALWDWLEGVPGLEERALADDLPDLTDQVIMTEDYAEIACAQYFEEQADFIRQMENQSLEEARGLLTALPPINDLVEKAQRNAEHITKASLGPLLAVSRCNIQSKVNFLGGKLGSELKVATDDIVLPVFQNTLAQPSPLLRFHPKAPSPHFYFYKIGVYSSVSEGLMAEFLASSQCSVSSFFDAIDCLVCKLDSKQYNRFLSLHTSLVFEQHSNKIDIGASFIAGRMRTAIPNFRAIPLDHQLTLGHLDITLDTVFIFRDNLACDHMVIFTDAVWGSSTALADSSSLIQVFVPKYSVRECDVCRSRNAAKIVFNSRVSHKKVSFLCQKCFTDLHLTEQGAPKVRDFQVFNYVYEER